MSESQCKGTNLEARLVPFPRSISGKAYDYLVSMVTDEGISVRAGKSPLPALDDKEGWAALKGMVAQATLDGYAYKTPYLTSSCETVEFAGAVVHVATPVGHDPADKRVIMDVHGGGMVYCGGEPCFNGARMQADLHKVRCYAVDYRTPPEDCYPAGLDDCVAVYRALVEQNGAENVIVYGISGGGNIAAAAVLRARDEGLPLPAGLVLITPEVDLTESGDSFETNAWIDVCLPRPLMSTNLMYAAGAELADPYLSPLFGDFTKGFPSTFLQAGTRDLFLSNTVRMHRALHKAGVPVELHIFEGMPHGGFFGAPEDDELDAEIARFVIDRWNEGA